MMMGRIHWLLRMSLAPVPQQLLDKLARLEPDVPACMHGSAWSGNGAELLRQLGTALVQN